MINFVWFYCFVFIIILYKEEIKFILLIVCIVDFYHTKIYEPLADMFSTFCKLDCVIWPWGYKTFFMLNTTKHEIYHAHKC